MNKTIQREDYVKKTYAKPQMKAYEVKPASIICASDNSTASTQNEEYQVESTTTTNGWFQ